MLRQDGSTLLHYASSQGHTELCTLLLWAKANIEAKDKVLEATRGDKHLGNMRTELGTPSHLSMLITDFCVGMLTMY